MLVRTTTVIASLAIQTTIVVGQTRFEHGWSEPRTWQNTKGKMPEAPILLLHEYEGYSAGHFYSIDGHEEGYGIGMELRCVQEFRDKKSLVLLDTGLMRLPLGMRITHFDARVFHADGRVRDLNKEQCLVLTEEHPYLAGFRQKLIIRDHGLSPMDQIEWIIKTKEMLSDGIFESRLMVRWPALTKVLMAEVQDEFMDNYRVVTYGELPEGTEHKVNGWNGITWTFHDMLPPDHSPILSSSHGSARFSIENTFVAPLSEFLARYDRAHPYMRFSGRQHVHAFLEHIEARKEALGPVSNAQLFNDIFTFVHDSITVIADKDLEENLPIGAYFHSRRMTSERIVVLYRQLANLLNEPLYVGFVRDRYSNVMSPPIRGEYLNERFLAIKDPASEGFLYITPNTLTRRYHFNDLPYWICGQQAWLMPFTGEGALDKAPVEITLPSPKPVDNSLSERIQLGYDPSTRSFRGRGRANLTGQLRMAWDTKEGDGTESAHPTLAKLSKRYPLWDSVRTTTTQIARTIIHYTPTIQPGDPDSQSTSGIERVDLFPFLQPPTWEQSGVPVTEGCMLPFPLHIRTDIHIDLPVGHTITGSIDTTMENEVGMVHYTFRRSPTGGYDWHLEHWIQELWLDGNNYPKYMDLMAALADRRFYTLAIQAASPATSPAFPAALEAGPR